MNTAAPNLLALQSALQAHLLGGPEAPAELLQTVRAGGIGPARRLAIYHQAYRARLLDTLRDSFGHTHSYLGDQHFDNAATAYIEAHPSATASLRWYGQGFPAWLQLRWPEDGEVGELAALDWALRAAFDSADAPTLTLADLAANMANAPDEWLHAPLHPPSSLALLRFNFNTLALWQALDDETAPPPAAPLPEAGEVLVWRRGQQPHFRSVSALEAAALRLLQQGRSFAALCEALAAIFPSEDTPTLAGALLRRWVDEELLCSLASAAPA
jgi:hypothetical protein